MNKNLVVFIILLSVIMFVGGFTIWSQGDESKSDLGQLPIVTLDTDSLNLPILNIQGIKKDNTTHDLDELKVCTNDSCWTVLNNIGDNGQVGSDLEAKKITDNTRIIDIGLFDLGRIDGDITTIEYVYNNKKGEFKLDVPIRTDHVIQRDLYLELTEDLSVTFLSLSFENGKKDIFIPDDDFRTELANGLIIDIEKGSTNEMANISISKIGELVDENAKLDLNLIKFQSFDIDFDDIREIKNRFPKTLNKEMKVYVPIVFSSSLDADQYSDYMKENYVLTINNSEWEYEIVTEDNQSYLLFMTKNANVIVLLFDK